MLKIIQIDFQLKMQINLMCIKNNQYKNKF